jgi:hypothetical protein
MNPRNRVNKLLEQARALAGRRRRAVRRRQCQNATWEELLLMVGQSIPPASWPVVEEILAQVEEYHRRPPRELANGEFTQDIHGFVYWLRGLQTGSSSLPETIPPELLLAWRNGHANHPAGSTPIPARRCEDCLLVLPNCTADGFGHCLTPCPACGGDNISHKDMGGNDRDGWDPMWVYTPLPRPRR